ncbi:MAG: hypothetical protein FWG85_03310 [Bacteroidetes bacterium]|nr:hypothetical protein [Bacteroidota bacterium]
MKKCAFIVLVLLLSTILTTNLAADIPKKIHFQAYLTDADGTAINRNVNLIVKFFDGEYSNYALYVNSSSDRNVKVENGLLNYYVNDLYDDIFENQLWVELTVDGVILNDRIPLTPSPYSFNSLKSNKAKTADTATFAKGLAPNSVTNNHIVEGAIKGVNIENNQISSDKLVLDDKYDWKGVHTYASTGVDMELNRNGYAINVIKGTVKISVIEADTLNTENITANTISTSEFIINDYIIKSDNNGLFIGTGGTSSASGLIFKDGILRYAQTPVFNNNSDNNSIITKKYLDDNISNLEGLIDDFIDNFTGITDGLLPNYLTTWNGTKLESSSIQFANNKLYYSHPPVYNANDGLALTTYNFVVSTIEDAVENSRVHTGLTNNYIPKWDADNSKFVNSSIYEDANRFVFVDNIFATYSAGYSSNGFINVLNNYLPENSDELTFASVGYVDYKYDALELLFNNKLITMKSYIDNSISILEESFNTKYDLLELNLNENVYRLDSTISVVAGNVANLTSGLVPHYLTTWNGEKFANSSILFSNNKLYYFQPTTYTESDALALTNKSYVDTAIKDAINDAVINVNNGMYNTLTSNYIPKWDGNEFKFINSSIAENTNKDTLLLGVNNSNGLIKVGDISFRITPSGASHYTDIFDVNHLHSIGISANVIEASSILTDNARYFSSVTSATDYLPFVNNELTFASKGYVDYSRDTLENYLLNKIENDSIDGSRIKNNTITSPKIESLDGSKIWEGTITGGENGQIANRTIKSGNIDDWAIQTRHIENESVTNPKISDDAITYNKIQDGAVINSKIQDGAVTNSKIDVSKIDYIGNTTTDFMPTGSTATTLTTKGYVDAQYDILKDYLEDKLENDSIDGSRIINNTITASKLANNSVSERTIQNNAIITDKIANGNVTNAKIGDDAVDTRTIIDNAITNNKIVTGAIDRRTILDGEIITDKIANGNVTNAKIGDNAVDTRTIIDNAITTPKIVDNAITTQKIQDGAVTDSKLKVSQIVYEGNHPDDFFMPPRRLSDDLWDDSVLTTHSLVNAYYQEAVDYAAATFFHIFNVNQWTAERIAPNSIHDYHLVTGAIRDRHLFVDNIEYPTNSAATYYMPTSATNRTLTTKGYVDNTIRNNIRNISSSDTDPTITLKNNTSTTAIKVESGNVVFAYIDVPVGNATTYTDLEGYGNYSVININNIVWASYNFVYLPRTGIQAGQILHISNSTNISSLETYNGTVITPELISGGSIPNGRAVSFIAINTSSGIKWFRLN